MDTYKRSAVATLAIQGEWVVQAELWQGEPLLHN